jgi:hypothetical protein
MPQGLSDVALLTRRGPAVFDRVRSIRFQTANLQQFRDTILIHWYRLPLRDTSAIPEAPFAVTSMTPLWLPGQSIPAVHGARLERQPNLITLFPLTEHPQVNFAPASALSDIETLVIRARFGYPDGIQFFFGKHWDGRGLGGQVPVANQWLDLYIYAHHNPFSRSEHGATLRFDPARTAGAIGSRIDIAGVWGSRRQGPLEAPDIEFYPAPLTEAPPH